jgi:hypothetical protein
MTFAEKAGRLFQSMIVVGSGDLSEPNSTFVITPNTWSRASS